MEQFRVVHIKSAAVATDDPDRPFLARITVGTAKRMNTLCEWPARSADEAQAQADDWLAEYCARLGLGSSQARSPSAIAARSNRLEGIEDLPELPVPSAEYTLALDRADDVGGGPGHLLITRRKPSYPTRAKVVQAVQAARSAGIDVAGIRVWPDGSIAAFDARLCGEPPEPDDGEIEFD